MRFTAMKIVGENDEGAFEIRQCGTIDVTGEHAHFETEDSELQQLLREAFKNGTVLAKEEYESSGDEHIAFDVQVKPGEPSYGTAIERNILPDFFIKECCSAETLSQVILV